MPTDLEPGPLALAARPRAVLVSEGEVSGRLLASYRLPADCPFESVGHAMIAGLAAGIRRRQFDVARGPAPHFSRVAPR